MLAVGAVVAAGVVAAAVAGPAPLALGWIVAALFAVVIVLAAGSLIRSRIVVTAREIVVRGLVFRRRRPRSRVVEAVRATIRGPRVPASDTVFLLDAHRGVLLRLRATTYSRQDMDRLVSALGVPCGGPDGAVTAGEFAKTYPGLVPWAQRHPNLLSFVITGVVCGAALAGALLSIAVAH